MSSFENWRDETLFLRVILLDFGLFWNFASLPYETSGSKVDLAVLRPPEFMLSYITPSPCISSS